MMSQLLIVISLYSCKKKDYQPFIVKNDSKDSIAVIMSTSHIEYCVQVPYSTSMERDIFIKTVCIPPHSYRDYGYNHYFDEDDSENFWLDVYIYLWSDVRTLSCEEFERTHPLKHVWSVTKAGLDQCGWILTYSPSSE